MQNTNRRLKTVHPVTSNIIMSAYVRDLQRAMHPERSKRLRRRWARIRNSR
jgi:hypothetical protein